MQKEAINSTMIFGSVVWNTCEEDDVNTHKPLYGNNDDED